MVLRQSLKSVYVCMCLYSFQSLTQVNLAKEEQSGVSIQWAHDHKDTLTPTHRANTGFLISVS